MKKLWSYILLLILLSSSKLWGQRVEDHDLYLDSLIEVYNNLDDHNLHKLILCDEIAETHFNSDSTIAYADRMIRLSKIHNKPYYECRALYYKSWVYGFSNDYDIALKCNFEAIMIADSLGAEDMLAWNNYKIGANFASMQNYGESDRYFYQAISAFEKIADTTGLTTTQRDLARNFVRQKMYSEAENMYRKAIHYDSLMHNIDNLTQDYTGIGMMWLDKYRCNSSNPDISLIINAKKELLKGYDLKSQYIFATLELLENLTSSIVYEVEYYNYKGTRRSDILDTLEKLIAHGNKISKTIDGQQEIKSVDIFQCDYFVLTAQTDKAKHNLDSISEIFDNSGDKYKELFDNLYLAYDHYYSVIGNYKEAYKYKSKYYEYIFNQSSINYVVESVQRVAQNELREVISKREQREQQQTLKQRFVLISLLILLIFIGYSYYKAHKHHQTITAKNKQITDSINYAGFIQQAVMPKVEVMEEMFGEFFLINHPLNIVAGDFYWTNYIGKYRVLVCADCTGHGVPGAFVSILGISLLNEISSNFRSNDNAATLLNKLRNKLIKSLGQSLELYEKGEQTNMDGMDLAIVMLDTESHKMYYAGANRPLYMYRKGTLNIYKPDKMPIGLYMGPETSFTNVELRWEYGDVIYLFSDGITDQFGYVSEKLNHPKRFSSRRLANLLGEIGDLPLAVQKDRIEQAISSWRNGYHQVDDMIMVGVKIG